MSLNGCNLQNNSPNTNATIMNGGATIEGCSTTNACGSKALLAQPDTRSGNIDIPIVTLLHLPRICSKRSPIG